MVEILPLGGLGEVGKNMTVMGFGKECVILDMGIRLDTLLSFEELEVGDVGREELIARSIIPDDTAVRGRKVVGIVISHAHLDHVGAVSKLAGFYKAPVVGTPYTLEVFKRLKAEERACKVRNRLIPLKPGGRIRLGGIEVEFIHANHSVPQTVFVLVGKGEKQVLYASDFKLDERPILEPRMDFSRLRRLDNLLAAMVGTVRLNEQGPIPSESWVAGELRRVLAEAHEAGKGVVITTFSSHLARIKSIVEISLALGRRPVIVGRSLWEYLSAGMRLGILRLPEEVRIGRRVRSSKSLLRKVAREREEYVLICTGHQGEPNSVLSLLAEDRLPYRLERGDSVIFSSSVIPHPINQANRELLETKLQLKGARIYREVHASGHAGRTETMEFLRLINPSHVVPCHGTEDRLRILAELAKGLGYSGSQIHLTSNGVPVEVEW
ncbi:MAG: MBL fold metallo-hydrolase [Candidatus Hadarchaeales archaeon]